MKYTILEWIWRIRYTVYMKIKGRVTFDYAYRSALITQEEIHPDWLEESPIDCARDDMDVWSD